MPKHDTGYELSDVSVGGILGVGLTAAIVGLLIGFALKSFFNDLRTRYHGVALSTAPFAPPPPRLQVDEAADLRAYREREHRLLGSYGRTREGQHIPIERAMEILAHGR